MSVDTEIDEAPSGRNFVTSLHSSANFYEKEITFTDLREIAVIVVLICRQIFFSLV